MADGIDNVIHRLPITNGEFGLNEANALIARAKACQNAQTNVPDKMRYRYIWFTLEQLIKYDPNHDFGVAKVEQKRAEAEQQQEERAARDAAEQKGRQRATTEAVAIKDEIDGLSRTNELVAIYDKIASLRARVQQLPPDLRSDLLDALQIAVAPRDKKRTAILADLQHALLDIQKLPDDEEKLRRLGELDAKIRAVPGAAAQSLADALETIRDATRLNISQTTNAPDAAATADAERLKEITQQNQEKLRAAHDAAAANAEREDLIGKHLLSMIAIYAVAKRCADSNIVFSAADVDALKQRTTAYIDQNKLPKEQVDQMWTAGQAIAMAMVEHDCLQLGGDINSVFGPGVLPDIRPKSPF